MIKAKTTKSGKCNGCKQFKILGSVTGWDQSGDNVHGWCKHCLAENKIKCSKMKCVSCSAFHMDKSKYDDGQCEFCQKNAE